MGKAERVRDGPGYLAKAISKHSVEGTARFLPAAYSKMWEERDKLREELLNKKKSGLGGFENSQPLQVAKDAEIKKWLLSTIRKTWQR